MSQRDDGRGEVTVTIVVQDWTEPILPTEFLRQEYEFETPEEAAVYRQEWIDFLTRRPLPNEMVRPFPRKPEPIEDELLRTVDHATEERLPDDLVVQVESFAQPEELDVPSFMRAADE